MAISSSKGGCSNASAVLNVVMTCVGVGIVSLPGIFSTCGMLGGGLILLISYALSVYSVRKLYYSLTNTGASPVHSFSDLGRALFGGVGALASTIFVQVTLIGVCGLLLTISGKTLSLLLHNKDEHWRRYALVSAAVLMFPAMMRTMHEIRLISAFGVVTLVGFIITTLVKCFVTLANNEQATGEEEWEWFRTKGDKIALKYGSAFATSFLSFFMATSVPSLLRDMRSPKALPLVIAVGSGIVLFMYALICVMCYITWGSKLGDVVDAMSRTKDDTLDTKNVFSKLANSLMLGTALAHYLPLMIPVSTQVDGWVDGVAALAKFSPSLRRVGTSVALVTLTLLIGLITKDLGNMITLLGSVTIVSLAIYLPVLYYFRARSLNKNPVSTGETAFLYLFFALGICISITTLYEVIPKIFKS